MIGCQTSYSASLPSDQSSADITAATTTAADVPAARTVAHVAAQIAPTFTDAAPTATPTPRGSTRTGTASMSKRSGPGWWTMDVAVDADEVEPSHGTLRLNTSHDLNSIVASSSSGT